MPEILAGAGLLDTSVLVDPASASVLPSETWVSALSLAELGRPHAASDAAERARRQCHLQIIEATYDPAP